MAGNSKEELDLARAYKALTDARSYARACMRKVAEAAKAADVAAARAALAELTGKWAVLFGKRREILDAALTAYGAWVDAGAPMPADSLAGGVEDAQAKGDAASADMSVPFPTDAEFDVRKLKVVNASPGGTTGAKIVEWGGRKYVLKQSNATMPRDPGRISSGQITPEHVRNEAAFDRAYRAFDPSSAVACRTYESGGRTYKMSEFLEGGKPLGEYMRTATAAERRKVRERLLDAFPLDALFNNWDVLGTAQDNVLVLPDGRVVRIDNGSCGAFRARGEAKAASEWGDRRWIDAAWSLRESPINRGVFDSFSTADVFRAAHRRMPDIERAVATLPERDRIAIEKPLREMRELAARCDNLDRGKFSDEGVSDLLDRSYRACKMGLREVAPRHRLTASDFSGMRPDPNRRLARKSAAWNKYAFADDIIAAAKSVNSHAPQHTAPNWDKVTKAMSHKAELQLLAAKDANAKKLLAALDEIEKSSANSFHHTVGKVERLAVGKPEGWKAPEPTVSVTEKVIDIVERGLDPDGRADPARYEFIERWCEAQSGNSWSIEACKAKILEFELRGKDPDPGKGKWTGNKTLVGPNGELYGFVTEEDDRSESYREAWEYYRRHPDEMERDRAAFRTYKACVQTALENIDFEGNDRDTGTVVLVRTEKESVMRMNGMREGEFGRMVRSGAESHSIFKTVCIGGANRLTVVRVPYSRISGMYFMARDRNGQDLFLGDGENEFNVDINNGELPVYYAGTVHGGMDVRPFVRKFLDAERGLAGRGANKGKARARR